MYKRVKMLHVNKQKSINKQIEDMLYLISWWLHIKHRYRAAFGFRQPLQRPTLRHSMVARKGHVSIAALRMTDA